MAPSLFITDITNNPNNRSGDWQYGGAATAPSAVFGTWKSFTRTVDKTTSMPTVTVTVGVDPVKNNWNLGAGSDPAPAGLTNEGYGAELRWSLDDLRAKGVLVAGHNYRFYVIVHDGDQNKSGGDAGQASFNYFYPGPAIQPASISGHVNSLEGPLANVTVILSGIDINGIAVTLYAMTDGSGYYQFINFTPGNYSLTGSKGLILKNDTAFAVEYATTNDPNKSPLTRIGIQPGALADLFAMPKQDYLWWRYETDNSWVRCQIPDANAPVYFWKFIKGGSVPQLVSAPELAGPPVAKGRAGPAGPAIPPIKMPANPGLAARPDLAVTITWNTKSDVDLWVTEPGAVCSFQNRKTVNGGFLHEDNQTGFGPEHYTIGRAPKGQYIVSVHHFRAAGPTTVQVEVIRFAGTANQTTERFTVNLPATGDRVEVCQIQY